MGDTFDYYKIVLIKKCADWKKALKISPDVNLRNHWNKLAEKSRFLVIQWGSELRTIWLRDFKIAGKKSLNWTSWDNWLDHLVTDNSMIGRLQNIQIPDLLVIQIPSVCSNFIGFVMVQSFFTPDPPFRVVTLKKLMHPNPGIPFQKNPPRPKNLHFHRPENN